MRRFSLIASCLFPLFCLACDDSAGSSSTELKGNFQTRGYGYTLISDGKDATLYESTSISCMKVADSPVVGMNLPGLGVTAQFEGKKVFIEGGGVYYEADRATNVPAECRDGGTKPTEDALVNFDILKATFAEQYAFFQLHGIDWETHAATYRARLTATSSRDELYSTLCEMITAFHDGHVSVQDTHRACAGEPVDTELQAHMAGLSDYFGNVLMGGPGTTVDANGAVAYRMVAPGVGHLIIAQMYVDKVDDEDENAQPNAMGAAIDRALAFFGDAGNLIVDVRANSGGMDTVSLAIAGRFTDAPLMAYTKKARNGNTYTAERTVTVEPRGTETYRGKVWLLTSRLTASAAETFSLMMRVNPRVTILGEYTAGAFSDILGRQLPNGMYFGLSNEVYRAVDGNVYEGLGVPPSIAIPYVLSDLAAGKDVVLDAALALATK